MFDERAFISQVETADLEEFTQLLMRPSVEQEKALRVYLGDERYTRMHSLALQRNIRRGPTDRKVNVVVLHGIMGSDLVAFDRASRRDSIWVNIFRLIGGGIERLRLADDGREEFDPEYDVRATGIMKRAYGELLLSLSERWTVRAFWYDWRKDLRHAADELNAQISAWFEDDAPVHLVAHSMGGLVARTFIKNHPEHWKAMLGTDSANPGGRLVMLGTPNHGSFMIPQTIVGLEGLIGKLTFVDLKHNKNELLEILNTFVGTYQMLPSHCLLPEMEPLYKASTYGDLNVSQRHLDNAKRHHEELFDVVDPERMVYVAGSNKPTFSNISDLSKIRIADGYEITMAGDGRVSHALGLLEKNGSTVPTFYIEENHGDLASNDPVLASLDELLTKGTASGLSSTPPARRSVSDRATALEEIRKQQEADQKAVKELARRVRTRSLAFETRSMDSRRTEQDTRKFVTAAERELADALTKELLGSARGGRSSPPSIAGLNAIEIEIGVVHGLIEQLDDLTLSGEPVDAISVGHYLGVKPVHGELALDKAISQHLPGKMMRSLPDKQKTDIDANLLITQYSERGIVRGDLGQPFFINDPRVDASQSTKRKPKDRVIAIAGMGEPARFGVPELTVLARELCWSLGRMGKKHLATVVIGAGTGNLPVQEAMLAWLRGVKRAISGSVEDEGRHLTHITFVVRDAAKMGPIEDAILQAKEMLDEKHRFAIKYTHFTEEQLHEFEDKAAQEQIKKLREKLQATRKARLRKRKEGDDAKDDMNDEDNISDEGTPTRITLELEGNTYRFGALGAEASVPERKIMLNPELVMRANDEMLTEQDLRMQLERGQFMEGLIVPRDVHDLMFTREPLVMMLDSTTARIHWEIIAQIERGPSSSTGQDPGADEEEREVNLESFLGIGRSFTRQLRTTFAPPPEPPPPPRRILRVLVVADPAEDAHLPGAEEEGVEVARLFESYNKVYEHDSDNRVTVERLFGPSEATHTNVLRKLLLRTYDVLHFAGHCVYDKEHPEESGWIFSNGERLNANELTRIDRIPKFIFSNACESGVTPDRAERRKTDLAPSFAEAFFARGVSNFVCTAWPVDDVAARIFALELYSRLLGLSRQEDGTYSKGSEPAFMHSAMRQARLAIAKDSENVPRSVLIWGAYQHYGNPYLRLFDASVSKAQESP